MVIRNYTQTALISAFLVLFSVFNVQAQQGRTCGFDDELARELATPEGRAEKAAYDQKIRKWINENKGQRTTNATYIIPTVVHVIQPTANDDLSDACIMEQIDILNEDFQKLNSDTTYIPVDFQGVAINTDIEFCLATIDPQGNPTNGIVRVVDGTHSNHSQSQAAAMKALSQWDPQKYLNIWIPMQLSGGLLGYATFPSSLVSSPHLDGIVISGEHTAGQTCAQAPYDLGRTATHEIGHWLGLYHTFQGGCAGMSPSDCATQGDEVCDTPPVQSSSFGCPSLTQNTCAETPTDMIDQTVNYMDYVDDRCMVMFSAGQADRMHATLNTTRAQLVSQANHSATGCGCSPQAPCTPDANFTADNIVICPNQTVNFSDQSTGPASTWAWIFTGGSPSSSTSQNPSVTYSTPGTYDVSLTITNSLGNSQVTQQAYITVIQAAGPPMSEGFETTLPSDWQVQNADGQTTWDFTSAAASSGSQCFWVNGWDYNANGTEDALLTRVVDLTNYWPGALYFDYSYKRSNFEFDTLQVWLSTDCGETWTMEWEKGAGDLATVGGIDFSGFIPGGSADWDTDSVSLNGYTGTNGFKAKFVCIGHEGSNLFLDNINLSVVVGAGEAQAGPSWALDVAPNPFKDEFNVSYSIPKKATMSFSIVDLQGRVLYQVQELNQAPGNHRLTISRDVYEKMSAGIYMLRGSSELGNISKKIVKME